MRNVPLNKILFLDIETVGCEASFDNLKTNKPELAYQFENYFDWFEKRFPEDGADGFDSMFHNRSALVGEFLNEGDTHIRFNRAALNTRNKTFLYSLNLFWVFGTFSHCRHRSGTA